MRRTKPAFRFRILGVGESLLQSLVVSCDCIGDVVLFSLAQALLFVHVEGEMFRTYTKCSSGHMIEVNVCLRVISDSAHLMPSV